MSDEIVNNDANEIGHFNAGKYSVIYVYSLPEVKYREGWLKVGMASKLELPKNWTQEELAKGTYQNLIEQEAHRRIREQTQTAARINYKLEHAEIALMTSKNGTTTSFSDHAVHRVLRANNIIKDEARGSEWFKTNLGIIKKAIATVKADEIWMKGDFLEEIILRREQKRAISVALHAYRNAKNSKKTKTCLWNAKMRFGKTLTTFGLVKELDEIAKITRVLILTHRPIVGKGAWLVDFKKFGLHNLDWHYGSSTGDALSIPEVLMREKAIAFASLQKVRTSDKSAENSKNIPEDESNEDDFTAVSSDESDMGENDSEKFENDGDFIAKHKYIFEEDWDLVVIDEAHEGTLTPLAREVMNQLKTKRLLHLSGTPFNLVADEDTQYDEVFSWDYIDEQLAKRSWLTDHAEDVDNKNDDGTFKNNPYESFCDIEFRTFDISNYFERNQHQDFSKIDLSASVNIGELFKVVKNAFGINVFLHETPCPEPLKCIDDEHEHAIWDWLSLISGAESDLRRGSQNAKNSAKLFPFSPENEHNFLDTIWRMPSVAACGLMTEIVGKDAGKGLYAFHPRFQGFKAVNATGLGVSESAALDSLDMVERAIAENEKTITFAYQMLTVGVTIPKWTGILMLNNSNNAANYFQSIFRTTSAGILRDGRQKTTGYVLDFNPNRCLEIIVSGAVAADQILRQKKGKKLHVGIDASDTTEKREALKRFLEFVNILSDDGNRFEVQDADRILRQVKSIYIQRTLDSGFDSNELFNEEFLKSVSEQYAELFNSLRKSVSSMGGSKTASIQISKEKSAAQKAAEEKAKRNARAESRGDVIPPEDQMSPEERAAAEEAKRVNAENAKNRQNILTVLRAISTRVPMMVFAAELGENELSARTGLTVENFTKIVDDESWKEFMPLGLMKDCTECFGEDGESNTFFDGDGNLVTEGERGIRNCLPTCRTLSWNKLRKCFDEDVFMGSCDEVRKMIRDLDDFAPLERAGRVALLVDKFSRPDKETVLTSFKVCNRHIASTLGGLRWTDNEGNWRVKERVSGIVKFIPARDAENYAGEFALSPMWIRPNFIREDNGRFLAESAKSRGVDFDPKMLEASDDSLENSENVGSDSSTVSADFWSNPDLTLIDLNSKEANYVLYAATSIFFARQMQSDAEERMREVKKSVVYSSRKERMADRRAIDDNALENISADLRGKIADADWQLWADIVESQLFVNTRVRYSALLAQRVLCGFKQVSAGFDEDGVESFRRIEANTSSIDVVSLTRLFKGGRFNKFVGSHGFKSQDDKKWLKSVLLRLVFNPVFLKDVGNSSIAVESDSEIIVENIESFSSESLLDFVRILLASDFADLGEGNSEAAVRLARLLKVLKNLRESDVNVDDVLPEKFTAAIGNPPYQINTNTTESANSAISTDIYPDFSMSEPLSVITVQLLCQQNGLIRLDLVNSEKN